LADASYGAVAAAAAAGGSLPYAIGQLQAHIDGFINAFAGTVGVTNQNAQTASAQATSFLTTLSNNWTGSQLPAANATDVANAATSQAAITGAQGMTNTSVSSQLTSFYGGGSAGSSFSAAFSSGNPPAGFTNPATGFAQCSTVMQTDTQISTGQWSSGLLDWAAGGWQKRYLLLRSNSAQTTYVYVALYNSNNSLSGHLYAEIGCYVSGVQTVFNTRDLGAINTTVIANVPVVLFVNGYVITVAIQGLGSWSYTDGGHVSQVGSSYRYGAVGDIWSGNGSSALAASPQLNNYGNLSFWSLYDAGGPAGPQTSPLVGVETTTSTSFTDLLSTTDIATVAVGPSGMVLVFMNVGLALNTVINGQCYLSFAASGANTIAAGTYWAANQTATASGSAAPLSGAYLIKGLTPGTTAFKLKYLVSAGTGYFYERSIAVVPL
jgi:hypothetical protein